MSPNSSDDGADSAVTPETVDVPDTTETPSVSTETAIVPSDETTPDSTTPTSAQNGNAIGDAESTAADADDTASQKSEPSKREDGEHVGTPVLNGHALTSPKHETSIKSRDHRRSSKRRRSRSRSPKASSSAKHRRTYRDRSSRDRSPRRRRHNSGSESEGDRRDRRRRRRRSRSRSETPKASNGHREDRVRHSASEGKALFMTLPSGEIDEESLPAVIRAWVLQRTSAAVTRTRAECEKEWQSRVLKAREDTARETRAMVEAQLADELQHSRKEKTESARRCEQMESKLAEKLKEAEESQQLLHTERLEMLEVKRELEKERQTIKKQTDKAEKEQQKELLNRGGNKRAPIKMSFGFK